MGFADKQAFFRTLTDNLRCESSVFCKTSAWRGSSNGLSGPDTRSAVEFPAPSVSFPSLSVCASFPPNATCTCQCWKKNRCRSQRKVLVLKNKMQTGFEENGSKIPTIIVNFYVKQLRNSFQWTLLPNAQLSKLGVTASHWTGALRARITYTV